MWQTPNQRPGAANPGTKKKTNDRLSRPFRLRRMRAAVRLLPPHEVQAHAETTTSAGEVREARVILNDLSAKGIGLYAPDAMTAGQVVAITLDDPFPITIHGKVVWCREEHTSGTILTQKPYRYRIGIKFTFTLPEQEKKLQEFCDDLQKNHLYKPQE